MEQREKCGGLKVKIVLAADHGGYLLKEEIKTALMEKGHEIVDLGTDSEEAVDYPVYGKMAGEYVDVIVNGKLIARGEVVVIDDNYGARITEIVSGNKRTSGN